jgi:hypothetical protein
VTARSPTVTAILFRRPRAFFDPLLCAPPTRCRKHQRKHIDADHSSRYATRFSAPSAQKDGTSSNEWERARVRGKCILIHTCSSYKWAAQFRAAPPARMRMHAIVCACRERRAMWKGGGGGDASVEVEVVVPVAGTFRKSGPVSGLLRAAAYNNSRRAHVS